MENCVRLAVLGSGKGSNFDAVLAAVRDGRLRAEVALVASDVPDAGILATARREGIPVHGIEEPRYRTRMSEAVECRLVEELRRREVDAVVLAGFLRVLKRPLLQAFPARIVNIHPSLLPAFPGLAAWRQALEAGATEAGCTVHMVDEGVDTGKILGQSRVPVRPDDTPESLHARIQEAEHELYPRVLARWLDAIAGGRA